jgi:heme-degrading monooxygenase HmoA
MYLNVFRSRKRPDHDPAAYAADAARMAELATAQPGFIDYKSFAAPDGESVTISTWADAAAAQAWAAHPEHRAAQARGRSDYYAAYTMWTCADAQERRFGP